MLKNNNAFCVLPFIHLHIDEKNEVKPCCTANESIVKFEKNFNFQTNTELNNIRKKMLEGQRVDVCKKCYDLDDAGTKSSRALAIKEWMPKLGIENFNEITTNLIYYDIRNDNLCNLACRMCTPLFSSQLEKEYTKLTWKINNNLKIPDNSLGFVDIVDIDTVQKIYVAGGEPTLLPGFKKFLEQSIACGRTDIEIRMNTNGTNLNKEFRQLLSHFKAVEVIVSLDGYNKINKYIRWPSDWQTIIQNVHEIYKITPSVSFNITVSIWNVCNLSKLVTFLEQEFNNPSIILNQVYFYGNIFDFDLFPYKNLVLNDLENIKNCYSYKFDNNFQSKIDYFIRKVESSTLDNERLDKFFEYNDALDKSRNTKLADYIPELEDCRNYQLKQS